MVLYSTIWNYQVASLPSRWKRKTWMMLWLWPPSLAELMLSLRKKIRHLVWHTNYIQWSSTNSSCAKNLTKDKINEMERVDLWYHVIRATFSLWPSFWLLSAPSPLPANMDQLFMSQTWKFKGLSGLIIGVSTSRQFLVAAPKSINKCMYDYVCVLNYATIELYPELLRRNTYNNYNKHNKHNKHWHNKQQSRGGLGHLLCDRRWHLLLLWSRTRGREDLEGNGVGWARGRCFFSSWASVWHPNNAPTAAAAAAAPWAAGDSWWIRSDWWNLLVHGELQRNIGEFWEPNIMTDGEKVMMHKFLH